jgi:hypothetical protein
MDSDGLLENGLITLALGMHLSNKGKNDLGKRARENVRGCRFDTRAIAGYRAPEDPAGEVKP